MTHFASSSERLAFNLFLVEQELCRTQTIEELSDLVDGIAEIEHLALARWVSMWARRPESNAELSIKSTWNTDNRV